MIDTFTVRCNILRLAFSGKLTEQLDSDGTALRLFAKINAKKSLVQTNDVPYSLPQSWAWAKLEDLYQINPKVDAEGSMKASFIPMERISAGFDRSFSFEVQNWEQASKNHTKLADNDVAFAKIMPCFENRKSFIARDLPNGIGGGTTELIVLRQSEILPEYTYYLVLDQRFINAGTSSYKGTVGQQRVQSDVIKNYLIPVAPYVEQQRIVEKIEQAFSVLKTIDELQKKYADNMTVLKSKLIDLAIRGKLTEQLPEDGTAEELFRQIQAEKQSLIKAGKIKKEKPLPEINESEIPFEIPDNWKWVRVETIGVTVTGGTPAKSHSEYYGGDYPFYKPSDLDAGNHIAIASEYLSETGKNVARQLQKGSILICCIGSIGKCAIIDKDGTANQQINALTPILSDSDYLLYAIGSGGFNNQLNRGSRATTVSIISKSKFDNCIVPLPPLAEQKRIVALLDNIMVLFEQ